MTDNERKLTEAAKRIADDLEKAHWALKECQKYNRLRNDLEAYLFEVQIYGLLQLADKPVASDFGIE